MMSRGWEGNPRISHASHTTVVYLPGLTAEISSPPTLLVGHGTLHVNG